MSIQLIQCGDIHLDRRFNISSYVRRNKRKEDINRNFSIAVEYALENKPDLFLIPGDAYDKVNPSNPARNFFVEKIRQLKDAGIHVFVIGGNHDVPKAGSSEASLPISVLRSAGLATVFDRSDSLQKQLIEIDGESVCISGKSYNTRNEAQNPLENEKIPLEGDHNILMLHASFHGLNVVSSVPLPSSQNPIYADNIQRGLNYLALGHYHNAFVRRFGDCTICNSGSVEKLTWSEENDKKCFIWAELKGSETDVELIPLETRKMESRSIELTRNSENPFEIIIDYLSEFYDPEAVFRLTIKGMISQEQHRELKIRDIYRHCQDKFFHFILDNRELEVEGYGRMFTENIESPIEAYRKRMERLIAEAESPEQKTFLEKVKEIGMKFMESCE